MPSDSFFNPDPTDRLSVASDIYTNTRYNAGGNVWYDVIDELNQGTSWDILNVFLQATAWDILNENTEPIAWDILNAFLQNTSWAILKDPKFQEIAWSIFPETLFFVQQFFAHAICFDFKTRDGQTVEEQYNLIASFLISEPTQFTFQIKEPVKFNFSTINVLFGSADTKQNLE
jgi:hypothetical protein